MQPSPTLISLFIQCGKSAAVFACAKEQGFSVIEVFSEVPFFVHLARLPNFYIVSTFVLRQTTYIQLHGTFQSLSL
jgi:hypothetical protein